jgi:cysteinyl-tRNA synthetase
MHNAFVQINKEKMSKSLGNFFTLKDIFKQYDPMLLRYYLACHNYNTPLEFDINELSKLQKSYQRLALALSEINVNQVSLEEIKNNPVTQKMLNFICDDLNLSGLFGVVFENLGQLDLESKRCVKYFLQQIIGLTLQPIIEAQPEITPEIQALIDQREVARLTKDWATADQIRTELTKLGFTIQDKK